MKLTTPTSASWIEQCHENRRADAHAAKVVPSKLFVRAVAAINWQAFELPGSCGCVSVTRSRGRRCWWQQSALRLVYPEPRNPIGPGWILAPSLTTSNNRQSFPIPRPSWIASRTRTSPKFDPPMNAQKTRKRSVFPNSSKPVSSVRHRGRTPGSAPTNRSSGI